MPRLAAATLLVFAIVFTSTGCAIMGESPARVGGSASLDDAARASKPDSSHKVRTLDAGYKAPPVSESSSSTSVALSSGLDDSQSDIPTTATTGEHSPSGAVLGVVAGGGTIGGSNYDHFGEFGLDLGVLAGGRWRFDLIGSLSPIKFADATIAGQSFINEYDMNLDITARYGLTPGYTAMGIYPLAGIRFGTLFWMFAQPVNIVGDDGKPHQVTDDHINHFSMYGGLGVDLLRTRHVFLGGQLLAGSRFYTDVSYQGFSNSLFPTAGFLQFRIEASGRK